MRSTSIPVEILPWEEAPAKFGFGERATRHGPIDGYLEELLGVGPREREALRRLLLESSSG